MKPLVSVITVTKNLISNGRETFFIKAVDSVQRQSYPEIEHIIIDGASSDGTLDLFKKVNFIENHKIYSEPDSGMWNAQNKGIKRANGKYIIFLNSDDYYVYDDAIFDLVRKIEEETADYCISNFQSITLNGEFFSDFCKNIPPLPKEAFYYHMTFNHETLLCKKEVYDELGYLNEKYKTAADYYFNIQLVLNGKKQAYLNKPTIAARAGGATICKDGTYSQATLENVKLIWNDFFNLHNLGNDDVKNILLKCKPTSELNINARNLILKKKPENFDYPLFFSITDCMDAKNILSSKWMKKLLARAEKAGVTRLPRFIYKTFSLYCKVKTIFKRGK